MFYLQRNQEGQLVRVETQPFLEMTEQLTTETPELKFWLKNNQATVSLRQLQQSDLEMVRVLEDLIQVLIVKGVISITDLPPIAQKKLMSRSQAREALGGLERLISDDEGIL